jgi:hypothetical protein
MELDRIDREGLNEGRHILSPGCRRGASRFTDHLRRRRLRPVTCSVRQSFGRPGFQIRWEPESVCVSQSGDLAYMIERNVTTVNDAHGNPVTTHGKVVTVWRKDPDGSWRNVVDMWNEAPPPPG